MERHEVQARLSGARPGAFAPSCASRARSATPRRCGRFSSRPVTRAPSTPTSAERPRSPSCSTTKPTCKAASIRVALQEGARLMELLPLKEEVGEPPAKRRAVSSSLNVENALSDTEPIEDEPMATELAEQVVEDPGKPVEKRPAGARPRARRAGARARREPAEPKKAEVESTERFCALTRSLRRMWVESGFMYGYVQEPVDLDQVKDVKELPERFVPGIRSRSDSRLWRRSSRHQDQFELRSTAAQAVLEYRATAAGVGGAPPAARTHRAGGGACVAAGPRSPRSRRSSRTSRQGESGACRASQPSSRGLTGAPFAAGALRGSQASSLSLSAHRNVTQL